MRKPVVAIAARACLMLASPFALAAAVPGSTANTSWFIGGIFGGGLNGGLPLCFGCEVSLLPSGNGTIGALGNGSNLQLSPGVPVVASDLSVRVDVAPGVGAKRIFFLYAIAAPSMNLRCEVAPGSTTCSSGTQTLAIPAASQIVIDAYNMGNAPASGAQYSWKATTP